jgi:hypothetical protein
MPLPPPQEPFADWPIQVTIPAGYIWYTEPGVLVTQAQIEHATYEHTLAMTTRVDTVVQHRKVELAQVGGLLIIHDWRKLKTWDNEARQLLVQRSRDRGRGVIRAAVIAISVNPLLRLLAQVVNVTMSAVGGGGVQVVDNVLPSLERYGVRRPTYASRFPRGW